MFFIEHNIAFDVADHLMDLIKSFDKNSPVLQKMTGDRTKVTKLVTNVVGEFSFNELVNYLKLNNFSIMVDESTDVGTKKNLAITVRYMRDGRVTDDFLALLEVINFICNVLLSFSFYCYYNNFYFIEGNGWYRKRLIQAYQKFFQATRDTTFQLSWIYR